MLKVLGAKVWPGAEARSPIVWTIRSFASKRPNTRKTKTTFARARGGPDYSTVRVPLRANLREGVSHPESKLFHIDREHSGTAPNLRTRPIKPHELRNKIRQTNKAPKTDAYEAKKALEDRHLPEVTHVSNVEPLTARNVEELQEAKSEVWGKRATTFGSKGTYASGDARHFAKYFRDRDRSLGSSQKASQSDQPDPTAPRPKRVRKRIPAKKYWFDSHYETPDLATIENMNSSTLKRTMINEAKKVSSGEAICGDSWEACIERAIVLSQKMPLRSLLRILQPLAVIQLPPSPSLSIFLSTVFEGSEQMLPKEKVFLIQSMARMHWRDHRLITELHRMILVWDVLDTSFLIKAANAIARLDLAGHIACKPLRNALKTSLPSFTGRNCQAIKAITVLELFDSQMTQIFLKKCEDEMRFFRHYNRPLELVEVYLRLFRPDIYSQLPDTVKLFLETSRASSSAARGNKQISGNEKIGRKISSSQSAPLEELYQNSQRYKSNVQEDVSLLLKELNIVHLCGALAGPFVIDILEPKTKTIIELEPEFQFYAKTTHLTSSAKWRRSILARMGFTLYLINERKWRTGLPSLEKKKMFLLDLLPRTLTGVSKNNRDSRAFQL